MVVPTITSHVNDESFLKQNQNNDEQWNESTPRDVFSEASLEEPNTIETDIGQDTEALSDYSEGRDAAGFRSRTSSSSSRFMSWMIVRYNFSF
uniref:Uncharacterized protein n=1 Tax=Parascaris equorum TaxID=6256 RepID=A0A914RSI2_PAREQ